MCVIIFHILNHPCEEVQYSSDLQVYLDANMQEAAASRAQALAALLRTAPQAQLSQCCRTAEHLLENHLRSFMIVSLLQQSGKEQPLVNRFWRRVMECPSSLAATVEALEVCRVMALPEVDSRGGQQCELLIAGTIEFHTVALQPGNTDGRHFPGWPDLVGSESLQQFAMDVLSPAAPERTVWSPSDVKGIALSFMANAGEAARMSETRLRALLTNGGLLAPLQAAAEGRADFTWAMMPVMILLSGCRQIHTPWDASEVHAPVQSALMAAMRQGTALLQLRAAPPPQQQRAVRRARREGFLQV